jgi:Bax protein
MIKRIVIGTVVTVSVATIILSGIRTIENRNGELHLVYRTLDDPRAILKEPFDCRNLVPVVYQDVPSLTSLSPDERKEAFIRLLLPSILIAETEIRDARKRALSIFNKIEKGINPTPDEVAYLSELFRKYRTYDRQTLLSRLNIHPPSIILAQAALESGWGRSRFFSKVNNVFGIWTFRKARGLKAVSSDARLSVYDSILDSVRDYLYNINVGWAYEEFRDMRSLNPNSLELVSYLKNYSTLGDEYVARLNRIIRSNRLENYDNCRIDPRYFN